MPATPSTAAASVFSPLAAGVSGILRASSQEQQQLDQELNDALFDLNTLMKYASNLVTLASRLAVGMQKSSTLLATQEAQSQLKLMQVYQSLGLHDTLIDSPVQKADTRDYNQALAKELYTFLYRNVALQDQLMMNLTDLYCLYNRARGVSLISPQELYNACTYLSQGASLHSNQALRLTHVQETDPYVFHEIRLINAPKHVIRVICRSSLVNTSAMDERIVACINAESSGLGLHELCHKLKVNAFVIEQCCSALELNGTLCRDQSLTGCKFFLNLFAHF